MTRSASAVAGPGAVRGAPAAGVLRGRTPGRPRRRARRMWALLIGLLALLSLSSPALAQQGAGAVLRADFTGTVTPVVAEHMAKAVDAAAEGGYEALLVVMDTPGGLETSMRDIVQTFLGSPVPVIVYVAPSGAQAASAGAIIAFSANIAAMAPGTNIGAATPIDLQGGEVLDKVVNNSAAYAEAIAEARGRDTGFAVDTVRDGRSATASAALELGAIDLVVEGVPQLLEEIDGRTVEVSAAAGGDEVVLDTAGARVVDYEMSFLRGLLQTLADPNIAFLLSSVGTLALIYELAAPGGGLAGVIGAIFLVLAFFALSVLSVDIAGLILLALAAGLFVAEVFVPGIGVFAGGGVLALAAAGLFLFDDLPGLSVDLGLLLPVSIAMGVAVVWAGRMAASMRNAPAYRGTGGELAGARGTVRRVDGGRGQAMVSGALWAVRSAGSPLEVGQTIEVVERDGLTLVVEPVPAGEAQISGGRPEGQGGITAGW